MPIKNSVPREIVNQPRPETRRVAVPRKVDGQPTARSISRIFVTLDGNLLPVSSDSLAGSLDMRRMKIRKKQSFDVLIGCGRDGVGSDRSRLTCETHLSKSSLPFIFRPAPLQVGRVTLLRDGKLASLLTCTLAQIFWQAKLWPPVLRGMCRSTCLTLMSRQQQHIQSINASARDIPPQAPFYLC